jgi:hypothetical protein
LDALGGYASPTMPYVLLSHVAGVKQSFETVFHAHIVELAKQTFDAPRQRLAPPLRINKF